jgi:hypothetical protein
MRRATSSIRNLMRANYELPTVSESGRRFVFTWPYTFPGPQNLGRGKWIGTTQFGPARARGTTGSGPA